MSQDRNERLLDQLAFAECRDTTFPFKNPPLVLDKAQGSYIWDVEGRRYTDLCAGFGALPLGHAHESVIQHLKKVCSGHAKNMPGIIHGLGDVYPSRAKIDLFLLLKKILPKHLDKGSFALSGSQAVEIAVKTALLATGKVGFIVFQGGYHGLDLGVLPLTSREDFRQPFLPWIKTGHVKTLPFNCEKSVVERALKEQRKAGVGTAGILVEPIQGRAGVIPAKCGWLESLYDLSKQYGTLLIFDEIFTGLGRCGPLTHAEKVPCDLLCLGKAVGGGFPLSACFGTKKAMDAWPKSSGEALHTGTFFGHPFSCEIGAITVQAIIKEKLHRRSEKLGKKILQAMCKMVEEISIVREVRGKGLMIAIEFIKPGLGVVAMNHLRKEGIIALVGGSDGRCLSLTPPLNIEEDIFFEALNRLIHVLRAMT